jgi:signal transduction histidine kinase/Tfp pilus assembly protein PilF
MAIKNRLLLHAFVSWLVCVLFTPHQSLASRIDSLQNVLATKTLPDSSKVNIYVAIAWEYKNKNINIDSIEAYSNRGIELASKIKYPLGTARCHIMLGTALLLNDDFDRGTSYLNDALSYFEKQPDSKELNEILHNLGLSYYKQTKLDLAIQYFERSKKVAKNTNTPSRLARAHYYLADIHNDQGNYINALEEYLQALKLYEKGGKKNQIANCLTNIATVHAQLKDFKQAQAFINRSLTYSDVVTNPEETYQNYSNIGYVYSLMKDYPNAEFTYQQGYDLTKTDGNEYWNTVLLSNLAEVYTSTGKTDRAIAAYNEVLKRNEKNQDITFTLSAHSGMGKLLYAQGKKKEAIAHLLEAFRITKENGLKRLTMETALDLANYYEESGDFKQALVFHKIHNTYNDSLFSESTNKKLQQLQFNYELEKKQRQIDNLQKNKEIQSATATKQRVLSTSLFIGLLLLSIIMLQVYRSKLSVRKSKETLQLQATKLEELNLFKDKIFSVLSHDLRSPVNSFTAAVQMLNEKDITPEEYEIMKPEINSKVNALNLMLDNVLFWAKSHIQEQKVAQIAQTDICELATQNINMLQSMSERKNISITNNINTSTYALCDAGQINIVLRNLLMNAIKYTRPCGSISLHTNSIKDTVAISVTDTGIGMTADVVDNLFATQTNKNTFGTDGEKGIGLGLILCHEFVKANNGSINVTSTPGEGSTFTLVLPKA